MTAQMTAAQQPDESRANNSTIKVVDSPNENVSRS